jgi:NADH:quinone reductase (non-electrogenic)
VLPQLGSVALQSGHHVGEVISRRIAGKKTKPFAYKDLAWLTVHAALLPTNEDRAKALVDWAGSGLRHTRAGRFTVDLDED